MQGALDSAGISWAQLPSGKKKHPSRLVCIVATAPDSGKNVLIKLCRQARFFKKFPWSISIQLDGSKERKQKKTANERYTVVISAQSR